MSSYYRQSLEDYLKTQSIVGGHVLDVGGSQNPISGRLKIATVDDYKILDNADMGRSPDIHFDLNLDMIMRSPETYKNHTDKYDVVFCLEVMEYIWNTNEAIWNLNQFLKKDGLLYITFPFLYPIHPPSGTDYLRYTKYGSIKLLRENGFEIVEYVPRMIKNTDKWISFVKDEKYRYDRNEDIAVLCESGCIIKAIKK